MSHSHPVLCPRRPGLRRRASAIAVAGIAALALAGPVAAEDESVGSNQQAIIAGQNADVGEYPFAVRLTISRSDGNKACGGSLIDPSHVLTAAHCIVGGDGAQTFLGASARIGVTNLSSSTEGETRSVAAADAVVHPRYLRDSGTLSNDVAVLRLNEPSSKQPIDLASPEGPSDRALWPDGTTATVIGWGWTNPGSPSSTTWLQEAMIPVFSDADTIEKSDSAINADLHIGAGGVGSDSCRGDSGGPLFVPSARGFQQIGVVSFGPLPCADGDPGVYTEVAGRHLYRWVKSIVDETPLVGDVDGDGDDDIVTATHQPAKDVYVARSLARQGSNRFDNASLWHTNFANDGDQMLLGDVNGDGRADLWAAGDSDVYVAVSNGSSFSASTVVARGVVRRGETVRVGDVTGDRRADLVIFANDASGDVFLATSTGQGLNARRKVHEYFAPEGETPEVVDVNGDRLADIVTFTQGMNGNVVYQALWNGGAFVGASQRHDYFAPTGEQPAVGSFNRDGLGDIATFQRGIHRDVYVGLRDASSGWFTAAGSGRWNSDFGDYPNTLRVGDVNGDGLDDLVNFTQGNQARVLVALNGGSSFGAAAQWQGYFAP